MPLQERDVCEVCGVCLMPDPPPRCEEHVHTERGDPEWTHEPRESLPMTIGQGGKYDNECSQLQRNQNAMATVVIVIGGGNGSGFSVSTRDPRLTQPIVQALRAAADEIERDAARLMRGKSEPL